MKIKRCHFCKKVLSTSKYSTESHRKDGYCSAKCKRKDRNREYRELNEMRPCDPDTGFFND
jgi:hypothetical protein